MEQEHYRKLEQMYLRGKITTRLYPTTTIKVGHGWAKIGLMISSDYFHAMDALHGSVYFKLLDDSAFFAANSVVQDVFVLTASFNIEFLRPATEGIITAEGELIDQNERRLIAESRLYDAAGKEIANGKGEFARSKGQLSKDIGYY